MMNAINSRSISHFHGNSRPAEWGGTDMNVSQAVTVRRYPPTFELGPVNDTSNILTYGPLYSRQLLGDTAVTSKN